jgi:hypothetical protein
MVYLVAVTSELRRVCKTMADMDLGKNLRLHED